MPDPVTMAKATVLAGLVAFAVMLIGSFPWRSPRPWGRALGWIVGIGAAFYLGCWTLDITPNWPIREDQDRFMLLLMPVVLAVEVVAALGLLPNRIAWVLRSLVAVCAARLLLHNSGYIADLSGPGSRQWTTGASIAILTSLGIVFVAVWWSMSTLASRAPSRAVPLTLALANGGAAVTVMLSGYATGGQPGLAMAAGLGGATLASFLVNGGERTEPSIGAGITALFAVLVAGYFFGELRASHGIAVFVAPLLAWAAALPQVRTWKPLVRFALQIVLVTIPLVVVVFLAQQAFARDYAPAGSDATDVSVEDYAGYGS